MRRASTLALVGTLAASAVGVAGPATPAGAAGPSVTVAPSINVARQGTSFVIKGSGFSATANGGLGVYVAFGPKPSLHPADWFNKIEYYQSAVWVHPGGTGTATNKPMNPNGTFQFTLTNGNGSPIQPTYGSTDCTRIQCGVVTMAAHGSSDRSQDSFRPVIYNTPDPTRAKVTVPYASKVAPLTGGTKPYTWSRRSGTIPPGLKLNAANGMISGIPTTEGIYRPVIRVRDAGSPGTFVDRTLLIRVAPARIVFTPSSLTARPVGVAFSRTIFASGGKAPYTFKVSSGSLPPGVTLGALGVLKGTPTVKGTYTFVVRAADNLAFAATKSYTQVIN
jgi:hypothetical protein